MVWHAVWYHVFYGVVMVWHGVWYYVLYDGVGDVVNNMMSCVMNGVYGLYMIYALNYCWGVVLCIARCIARCVTGCGCDVYFLKELRDY